ncbi:hypothetical protein RUND412_005269 [Rhizina undulata]
MGLFGGSSGQNNAPKEALTPWPTPLGVLSDYCRHNNEFTIKLREKKLSLTGDDFQITTTDGNPFLRCKGQVFSIRDKKVITTADGVPLLNIQDKLLTIHTEYKVFLGEGSDDQVFHVRGHWTPFGIGGAKMTVTFRNRADGTNQELELNVEGDFFDRNARIKCQGKVVARIDRSFMNAGQLLFNQQTYYLTCAPRVDCVMMAVVCICLDEKANEKK